MLINTKNNLIEVKESEICNYSELLEQFKSDMLAVFQTNQVEGKKGWDEDSQVNKLYLLKLAKDKSWNLSYDSVTDNPTKLRKLCVDMANLLAMIYNCTFTSALPEEDTTSSEQD